MENASHQTSANVFKDTPLQILGGQMSVIVICIAQKSMEYASAYTKTSALMGFSFIMIPQPFALKKFQRMKLFREAVTASMESMRRMEPAFVPTAIKCATVSLIYASQTAEMNATPVFASNQISVFVIRNVLLAR